MYLGTQRAIQYGFLAANMTISRARAGNSEHSLKRIVDRLGMMHGLPQKIGQLLSFSEIDSSHPAYTRLTENEPSLSLDDAKNEFERQLGSPIETFFATFDSTGIGASIGQVHQATLKEGKEVAVKIQYPGIRESVLCDLKALGWLMKPIGGLNRGFDIASYRQEIGESLYSELDYVKEIENTKRFAKLASGSDTGDCFSLRIPEVFSELSNDRILTSAWIEGHPISRILDWPVEDRRAFSETLVELFLKSLLEWGLLHADPNPGNYRFFKSNDRPTIGLIDFGCMKEIHPDTIRSLRETIFNTDKIGPSPSNLASAFESMGFNMDMLKPMKDKLSTIVDTLRAPFLADGVFNTREWRLSTKLKTILGKHRMNFRMAGPSDLLFILRSFQGLNQFLMALDAPIDWKQSLSRVRNTKIDTAHHVEVSSVPFSDPKEHRTMTSPESEALHIQVQDKGSTKARLTFGAKATDALEDLVPSELRERIDARGIDLSQIVQNAQNSNYAVGELFSLADGSKEIKVWLE